MEPVIWLINTLFSLYWWVILASVVLSWLVAFNIVITQATLDNLYVERRLRSEDLQVFDGEWSPSLGQD